MLKSFELWCRILKIQGQLLIAADSHLTAFSLYIIIDWAFKYILFSRKILFNTVFMFLFLLSCQFEVDVPVQNPVVETAPRTVFEPLPWPKEGVLQEEATTLDRCLDKVPSCECWFEEQVERCAPQFVAEIVELPHLLSERMGTHTWSEDCPVGLEDLRLLRVIHWTETGKIQWGSMVLTSRVVEDAKQIFQELYMLRFPIHSLNPAVEYEGSDDDSMADNNSSAFNCRKVKGSNRWSEHSYGEAIDINPLWNPWVKGDRIYPKNAGNYVNRELTLRGMIKEKDPIVSIFESHGWRWGSQKTGISDYQHFSRGDHQSVYAP